MSSPPQPINMAVPAARLTLLKPTTAVWDERVAREVEHQARIEAAFDRADAFRRLGHFAREQHWLDTAERLSGGLAPAYLAQQAHAARELARQGLSATGEAPGR